MALLAKHILGLQPTSRWIWERNLPTHGHAHKSPVISFWTATTLPNCWEHINFHFKGYPALLYHLFSFTHIRRRRHACVVFCIGTLHIMYVVYVLIQSTQRSVYLSYFGILIGRLLPCFIIVGGFNAPMNWTKMKPYETREKKTTATTPKYTTNTEYRIQCKRWKIFQHHMLFHVATGIINK